MNQLPLYRTARASRQPFYYEFNINENGTYLASTLAFVNAIEFFLAPSNFSPENYTGSLHLNTIYRLNVGGPKLTPDNDTKWRNWETDDGYLLDKNSAVNRTKGTLGKPLGVNMDGLVAPSVSVAPDLVFLTAKAMNNRTGRLASSSVITWAFRVSRNARHVAGLTSVTLLVMQLVMLYLTCIQMEISRRRWVRATCFLISWLFLTTIILVSSNDFELMNISIGPNMTLMTDTQVPDAFLNGLEILEVMEAVALIPNVKKKISVALVVSSVLGGLLLVCILTAGFMFGLRRRRKAEKRVETSDWSPMPENGGGTSHTQVTDRTITGSPMNLRNLGLRISFAEIPSATNNFDTELLIGKDGFGNVYRGTLLNGTKVTVKRAYK